MGAWHCFSIEVSMLVAVEGLVELAGKAML